MWWGETVRRAKLELVESRRASGIVANFVGRFISHRHLISSDGMDIGILHTFSACYFCHIVKYVDFVFSEEETPKTLDRCLNKIFVNPF